jgi:ATP-binding cassette subfamily F protein uup
LPPIIAAQEISKRYGIAPLFKDISFTISEGERIGVIGPNGSGKSTLLEILYRRVKPDSGDVAIRKHTKLSYVSQVSEFDLGETVRSVIERALKQAEIPEAERASRFAETLGRTGFVDLDAQANSLSGGWKKRLAIAAALAQEPNILLLDEPTNHLDLAGIKWLEGVLQSASFACVAVSHDRYFLENVATEVVELNRSYENGLLRVAGNYSEFLEAKEQYLHAQQRHQEALENRVHTELEWLRRGPKARATKAKARIDKAHKMIGELADLKASSQVLTSNIEFVPTNRKTKQLITLEDVGYSFGERTLFENVNFTFTSGMRVGLVGPNGSGKTTLLRILRGEIAPIEGAIRRAEQLRIVYFDQNRSLDPELSLRRALAPDSDAVIYQERVIHVASWAARFLFAGEDLERPVGRLSGGERARVLIAQLMLQPADVLLLDEPTNDLDIPTLEILEETLLEYTGALVLVTHDRFMLDRVSNIVLGLDGIRGAQRFADYSQWEEWQRLQVANQVEKSASINARKAAPADDLHKAPDRKKKLSYREAREFAAIEQHIVEAEQELQEKHAALEDPAVTGDARLLRQACLHVEEAQKNVDRLYARWQELEGKLTAIS